MKGFNSNEDMFDNNYSKPNLFGEENDYLDNNGYNSNKTENNNGVLSFQNGPYNPFNINLSISDYFEYQEEQVLKERQAKSYLYNKVENDNTHKNIEAQEPKKDDKKTNKVKLKEVNNKTEEKIEEQNQEIKFIGKKRNPEKEESNTDKKNINKDNESLINKIFIVTKIETSEKFKEKIFLYLVDQAENFGIELNNNNQKEKSISSLLKEDEKLKKIFNKSIDDIMGNNYKNDNNALTISQYLEILYKYDKKKFNKDGLCMQNINRLFRIISNLKNKKDIPNRVKKRKKR